MTEFVKPMLARRETEKVDRASLHSGQWAAEPKLDGERIQVHVKAGRVVAAYSRTGRDILIDKRLEWLRQSGWDVESAVFDGEAYTGGGTLASDRIGTTSGQPMGVSVFDLLEHDGLVLMSQPYEIRRARLEAVSRPEKVGIVPASDDWRDMWSGWVVGMGGEGVMLKKRDSRYLPGKRSPDWLKLKVELTTDVVIVGLSDKATYRNGGYKTGEVALEYGYWDGRQLTRAGQGLKVGTRQSLEPFVGRVAEVLCNGIGPDGSLRHGRFIRWRDDKPIEECTL